MTRHAVALAPAKINVGLEVIGRRADGYHDIVSVLQTVSLFDRLEWSDSQGTFRYESPPRIDPAADLTRAALRSADNRPCWTGQLRLHKGIPIAAGLGGGSSDAALALRIAFPDTDAESIAARAMTLGSDVPFFLEGGTALATGSGNLLETLPRMDAWCVIVIPHIAIPNKTQALYAALTPRDYSDGSDVRRIARAITDGDGIATCPPNAFTAHLMKYSAIRAARDALQQASAPWVSVSGAGPSLYALVKEYGAARRIAARVPPSTGRIFIARTLPRWHGHLAAENVAKLLRHRSSSR